MKISVLGAGAWGTAMARLLCLNQHEVTLWSHSPERVRQMQNSRRNEQSLRDLELPPLLNFDSNLPSAVEFAEVIVVAVPSAAVREVSSAAGEFRGTVVSLTKGIEYETGLTMSRILVQNCPKARCAAISGPSFASEVARDIPTAVVAASSDPATAQAVQDLFVRPSFRVYTSTDCLGVELGGALKNIIAIGAGCSDGLGLGDNTKAALVTRAIVELKRFGMACGAQEETFTGLSGLGDLIVTCFSRLSRNRAFGERVGRGETPARIFSGTHDVVEGYPTARSAFHLARKLGVCTPVIDEIYALLYEGKDVQAAVSDLMTREPRPEADLPHTQPKEIQ
jgi:glycerol-3-phosphate dehydrogenase (NAD(P)+)